jgi:glycosyltransferase involved in cell wall biosynthesis
MMRICQFTTTHLDAHYFRNLTDGLTDAGHSVLLMSLGDHKRPEWVEDNPAAEFIALNRAARPAFPAAVRAASRQLREFEAELLQTHLFDAGAVGTVAGRLGRVPTRILTRHHLDEHQLVGRPLHIRLDKWMARSAHGVVVPSNALKRHMQGQEGLRDVSIEVIPYGLDDGMFESARATGPTVRTQLGLDGSFVIGYTGRLVPNKGLAYLFEAMPALSSAHPELRLLLVGEETAWSRRAVNESPHRDAIITTGFRADAPACIAAMDVAVHPSLSDSLPQVVLEAFGVGTPVVATAVGGIPEMVKDGSSGLLIAPADSQAITAAVDRLYADPRLRERLVREGTHTMRTKFSVGVMIERYLALYERLMSA